MFKDLIINNFCFYLTFYNILLILRTSLVLYLITKYVFLERYKGYGSKFYVSGHPYFDPYILTRKKAINQKMKTDL